MSSEEMRVDLESFVNKGLHEGWRGWPVKYESGRHNALVDWSDPRPTGANCRVAVLKAVSSTQDSRAHRNSALVPENLLS